MKKIIFVLCFLLFLSTVSAFDFFFIYNYTSLPIIKKVTPLLVISESNYTRINMTYGRYLSGEKNINTSLNSFLLNYTLTIPNTQKVSFLTQVNLTILKFINKTFYNNITNQTIQNNSYNIVFEKYGFNITVINNTPIPTEPYIRTDVNKYSYFFCDFSLPKTMHLNISISALWNSTLQITCINQSFLQCPSSFIITNKTTNTTTTRINFTIPKGTEEKTYISKVKFQVAGRYNSTIFTFVIEKCVRPPFELNYTGCYGEGKTDNEVSRCIVEKQMRYYEEMLRNPSIIRENITQYVNRTEYEPVYLARDPLLINIQNCLSLNKELQTKWNETLIDNRECHKTKNEINENFITCQKDFIKEKEGCSDTIISKTKDLIMVLDNQTRAINVFESKYFKKDSVFTVVVYSIIMIFIVGWLIYYSNEISAY